VSHDRIGFDASRTRRPARATKRARFATFRESIRNQWLAFVVGLACGAACVAWWASAELQKIRERLLQPDATVIDHEEK